MRVFLALLTLAGVALLYASPLLVMRWWSRPQALHAEDPCCAPGGTAMIGRELAGKEQ